ncbi:hypothetical protein PCCS19_08610 [Paenibacillus sp. CCS19]|nr:hypothetical protein PCCS19_08610 [Paenibacillus cellulosilyticus]
MLMLIRVLLLVAAIGCIAGCSEHTRHLDTPEQVRSIDIYPDPNRIQNPTDSLSSGVKPLAASVNLIVNGVLSGAAPQIINSSTYVPVRAAGEMLNKIVQWDAATKTVYINDQQQQLVKPTSTKLKLIVNGKTANASPIIVSGSTYVPIRAAGEMLSKYVSWNGTTKTVFITDKQYDYIVEFPAERYPETAAHIKTAIKRGKSAVCTIDRAGAANNREASLQGIPTKTGYDRDEFPMAMCAEGGAGADVAYVISSDNRGAGSWVGNKLDAYPDGKRVLFVLASTSGAVKQVTYKNCTEVRAAGAAPLYRGDPGYSSALDRDNDGVACES